ncbi:CsbD family protein [Nocardia sp. SYP-A9097]|uniref:CsbD family protein n=1 Tax=Nocardia sp. SYP-A9097 TaxID=2663237 RepID=UPI00129AC359|nr:CsbD family protein [Nocardia sp. SYP-A9097]MRH90709.1 CsbD family protein [Nocardia sp. SYP-A9097]
MSALDKAKNKADELAGRVKETTGKATGDESQENEGKADRAKADLKDTGEKVKDAFRK